MIIVELKGGLGNQLFQYATARRLSEKHQVELKFDIKSFNDDALRDFSLSPFNINGTLAEPEEILNIRKKDKYLRYIPGLSRIIPVLFQKILRAPGFQSRSPRKALKAGKEHYLQGYWADEKLFTEIQSLLLKELTIKQKFLTKEYSSLQKKLQQENSVSVHIRRGDYASNTYNQSFFGLMPLSYYKTAVDTILEREKEVKLYIFSDDIQWVRDEFDLGYPFEAIGDYGTFTDYHEITLMANCKHNIIANSTFSWWGAWLNPHIEKIVVAPQKWYQNAEAQDFYERHGFVPNSWIKK